MKVLVACEFSGVVRRAFAERGHDAWSCDYLPTEISGSHLEVGSHLECDVQSIPDRLWQHYDLMIAHPPCRYLAVSGARWFAQRLEEQQKALEFVRWLLARPVKYIALENPISVISSRIRKPDQIVQPWWFGHGETKATCLWLKGLPPLRPTQIVGGRKPRVHYASPGPDRWKERSRTLKGIADAMGEQWGKLL